ncbi:PKD domain-containing protein, partial [Thalassotalea sp. PLHSN55]|uniref:PKD domain-containing protein n=1 Tax=Thalassotalea sp. PLHSN55 TaxID=3435888 RepID=UPI003F8380A3
MDNKVHENKWLSFLYKFFTLYLLSLSLISCGGDSGGSQEVKVETKTIEIVKQQPVSQITTSLSSTNYKTTDIFNLTGTALDHEDGELSGNNLVWVSSKDGTLGNGIDLTTTLTEGAHTVSLTATDSDGLSHTDFITIIVSDSPLTEEKPLVNITSPTSGESYSSLEALNFTASTNQDNGSLSWISSIDGSIGSGASISTNLSIGIHLISVTVTDSNNVENISTIAINIISPNNDSELPPIANSGTPQSITEGIKVNLDGSASIDSNNLPLIYSWSFESKPNDSNATIDNPNSISPSFTPDVEGDYLVKLIVNNGSLTSAPSTVLLSTLNFIPVAHAGEDKIIPTGVLSELDGSRSYDINDQNLEYTWSIINTPSGSTSTLESPNSEKTNFTPDIDGEYQLGLVVNDGIANSFSDSVTLFAGNIKPNASAVLTSISGLIENSTVTFNAENSSDINNDELTYIWFLEKKPNESSATLSSNSNVTSELLLDSVGQYEVSLVVNDGSLDSDKYTINFSVIDEDTQVKFIGFEDDTTQGLSNWLPNEEESKSGTFSLQPPFQSSAGSSSTEITLSESHTKLTFWAQGSDNVTLYIDGTYWATYNPTNTFFEMFEVIVPEGGHTYRWDVTVSDDGWPDLYLDDISISHSTPQSEGTSAFGFEGNYLSQDFSGDWAISRVAKSGQHSLQAPYQSSPGTTSTEITLSESHTKLTFWAQGSDNVILYIDGTYWATYNPTNTFFEMFEVIVPEGGHTYRWD